MEDGRIKTAKAEAKRFLKRLDEYEQEVKARGGNYDCPKESGALRRASMDLTRALAEMRKP
jgi:hypothetical protein